VLCEYDALPEHRPRCGHNVIAAAGLGAGLALAAIADDAGGQVRILGTPAEEGGGGKMKMAAGARSPASTPR
jgi:metal-dependent amidase/aminoacylase/carboxypeptidase family protein